MGPDCYKVEVLHYLNPHLIWVEVSDPSGTRQEDFAFEQIGIYGVLPQEATIDVLEENVKIERCENWTPAATTLMKKVFLASTEIFFCPTHIDRRSSIFDDNIHKYGEIIVTLTNGKQKKMSKLLIKSDLALYDECLFHQELRAGNFKTKLNTDKTVKVITELEKYYMKKERPKKQWEKSVRSHTTVFQAERSLESTLTVENLKAFNRKYDKKLTLEDLLQRKSKDLKMCRDIDEESVGRGLHRTTQKNKEPSAPVLKKKPKLIEKIENKNDLLSHFKATKHFVDVNAFPTHVKDAINDDKLLSCPPNLEKEDKFDDGINVEQELATSSPIKDDMERDFKSPKLGSITAEPETRKARELESQEYENQDVPELVRKPKKSKSSNRKFKVPKYDINTQKCIAYGPPETDRMKLNLKVIQKEHFSKSFELPENIEDEIQKKNCNAFGDVDSDNEIEVAAKKNPKTSPKKENEVKLDEISPKIDTKQVYEDNPEELNKVQNASTLGSILKRRLQHHKVYGARRLNNSLTSTSDTSNKDSSPTCEDVRPKKDAEKPELDSDDECASEVLDKLNLEYPPAERSPRKEEEVTRTETNTSRTENHPNPFKNIDPSMSVFVEELVTPVLMVHTKNNNRILPTYHLRDIHFTPHIYTALKTLSIERAMTSQTVSWLAILRGYSIFMISPKSSGKTMGYLPAVCRLIADSNTELYSVGPTCIIVCATASSVAHVEKLAKMFLDTKHKVLACYSGMDELKLATSLLNGCDLLITTPSFFVRMLQTDFGVDLRRLTTFVLDDCERLSEVYLNEIKFFVLKIKEMLKSRTVKELKVQYILASRVWCEFMESLAKKVPDTVISISAFQECVLYAKANTTASFVTNENKINAVLEFMKEIDTSKRTVIVCRNNEEVEQLEKALKRSKFVVFACNDTMTVQELYKLKLLWNSYQDSVSGPILVCCDENLMHMNVTNAHNLFHYSLPLLFSMFCIRFSVLNDNYPSIFKENNETVKIKILLDDTNVEQLPKIMHFIKRCTNDVPKVLDEVCEVVLAEKDIAKAKKVVPVCDRLLTLGECPDFWNCQERHAIIKEFDKPKDWVPTSGIITFKILHYHDAVLYSARLLTNIVNSQTTKYPQTYNMLSMKMATYYAKESNRKLHGIPEVGDMCAVAVRQNFFSRCQVVKILSYYQKGNPNHVLVRMIDEERLEKTRDIYLFYLPDEIKKTETHVVHVRLADIQPKDKDITFSELARDQLRKITEIEDDFYLRGQIILTIGNCIFMNDIETCRDLSSVNKTVITHSFRQVLEAHAISNPEHIPKLEKLCEDSGLTVNREKAAFTPEKPFKKLPEGRWAHLERDDFSAILFASAGDPSKFFIRLVKFEDCMNLLIKDIQKHIAQETRRLTDINKGDIVLAELPDDGMYERARIDEIYEDKVKCFFVDQGDWRDVSKNCLAPITKKLITLLPYQAIECRLIGVKPPTKEWNEFSINWFINQFEDNSGELKQLYVKYFTKETAQYTGGHKYGIVVIDTNAEEDIVINNLMIQVNMAREHEAEIEYLDKLNFKRTPTSCVESSDDENGWEKVSKDKILSEIPERESPKMPINDLLLKKPIRSVPLVGSDDSEFDDMDINITEDFMGLFNPKMAQNLKTVLPAIKTKDSSKVIELQNETIDSQSGSDESILKTSSSSDIRMPSQPKKLLDSDDLTTPDQTQLSDTSSDITKTFGNKAINKITTGKIEKPIMKELASRKFTKQESEIVQQQTKESILAELDLRKPKLCWRQNKTDVFIKILLIGVEDYLMEIKGKTINFEATVNDTKYGFEFELYGGVDTKKSRHSNKGQYILVVLKKILTMNWLTLTRQGVKKWIVYDVDHIDESSEEEEVKDDSANIFKQMQNSESESDEDFFDDSNFKYKRDY